MYFYATNHCWTVCDIDAVAAISISNGTILCMCVSMSKIS